METGCPGVPPLLAALLIPYSTGWPASRKPQPPLVQDRDTLEYFEKIFWLGTQLAMTANNLGVLGIAAAYTPLERTIGGVWLSGENRHINLLELQVVLLVFQHILTLVQGRHVLVKTDNCTTVAYINRHGEVQSAALLKMAENQTAVRLSSS